MLKINLEKYYRVMPFSIGTHCTKTKDIAEKILKEGLKEYCSRALEGTLFMHGDFVNAKENDLTASFLNNNFIIVVAVPMQIGFEAKPDGVVGGDTITNEFSALFTISKWVPKVFPEFIAKDCVRVLPSKFILGYYDKNNNEFFENPNSMYKNLNKQEIEIEIRPYIQFLNENMRSKNGKYSVFMQLNKELNGNKYIKWKTSNTPELGK